jgi:lipopolysaccharide export LptBFGC system permease protein LptF
VRVFAPGVLLGVLVAGASLAFNGYLQPWAKTALRRMAQDNMAQIMKSVLRNKTQYSVPKSNIWFTWKRFSEPNVIHDVNFFMLGDEGNPKLAVHAEKAYVSVTRDGRGLTCVLRHSKGQYEHATLDGRDIVINKEVVESRRTDLHEHTIPDLYRELDVVREIRERKLRGEATARALMAHPPELYDDELAESTLVSRYDKVRSDCHNKAAECLERIYEVRSEAHARNALSLMPIVFAMIGIPLAVALRNWHMLVAFAVAVGVAFAIYMMPLLALRMAAEDWGWAPWLMQIPNAVVGLAGLALMTRMTLR